MAPPKSRRPGFSRKAQYGLFLGYVVAVAGIMFGLLLLAVSILDPAGFNAIRGAALDVTTPVTSAGRSAVRGASGAGNVIGNYFLAGSQNAALKRDLAAAERRLVAARAIEFENRRLRSLLKLSGALADDIAVARIVGSTFEASRRLATLNAGTSAGIRIGQPVRGPEGLIGRIVETGRAASRVLLVTDGASNVPVRLVRDGTPALATGRGDGTIELKPLEVGKNPFRRGDLLVTSGVGGLYAPGIPVAVVISAGRDETVARPLADPARIDFAIVEAVYEPAAGEPAAPADGQVPSP